MHVRSLTLFALIAVVLTSAGVWGRASAAPPPAEVAQGTCQQGTLDGGALFLICTPPLWNGDVVLWAHGYVAPQLPIAFEATRTLYLPDNTTYLPDLVMGLGYAFAATSYRANGLAVKEAQADMLELLAKYRELATPAPSSRTYLAGASMGGLVATLLAEKYPEQFSGALASCGIVGDFRRHITYWGDFRVLFDYFFPGVLPGTPTDIPQELIENWDSVYVPRIVAAVSADPLAARQLIAVSKAPIDPAQPQETTLETILRLLWFNVFGAQDIIARLGGIPFDNLQRWYWGSRNDLLLNLRVRRIEASPDALLAMRDYETTGGVSIPMVLPHTTGDPVVRVDQTLRYWLKLPPARRLAALPIPVPRYGHCTFTPQELISSFGLLVFMATGQLPPEFGAQTPGIDRATLEQQLAAQIQGLQEAEAKDSAIQAQGGRTSVFLPLVAK